MQKAEKKLGCLKGIARANMPNVGTIEGSVNLSLTKGGKKQVSIEKEGKVISSVEELKQGDKVSLRLQNGTKEAVVE